MREPYFVEWSGRPRRQIFPGVHIAVATGERLMLARVALDPGAVVPEHQHPHEQFGLVLEGTATFTVGGETRALRAGDTYAIPGDVRHSVLTGPDGAVCLDIFSPPREEYR
jgi:quercetin dioxygenase-like cupin family protein